MHTTKQVNISLSEGETIQVTFGNTSIVIEAPNEEAEIIHVTVPLGCFIANVFKPDRDHSSPPTQDQYFFICEEDGTPLQELHGPFTFMGSNA